MTRVLHPAWRCLSVYKPEVLAARRIPMFTTRRDCALRHVHRAGSHEQLPRHFEEKHLLDGVMGYLRSLTAQEGAGSPFASISPALGLRGGHSTEPMKEAKTGVEFPEDILSSVSEGLPHADGCRVR